MARTVATRYENALLYGPGRSVGYYPERSPNTLPQPITLPSFTPAALPQAAPVEFMSTGFAPVEGLSGGNALLGGPAALSPLARLGIQAGGKLLQRAVDEAVAAGGNDPVKADGWYDPTIPKPEALPPQEGPLGGDPKSWDAAAVGAVPVVPWGGGEAGLVPANANPFGADVFWAPQGYDLGVGAAGAAGALGGVPAAAWGGAEAGLVPAGANPFGAEVFWAPNGIDLGASVAADGATGAASGASDGLGSLFGNIDWVGGLSTMGAGFAGNLIGGAIHGRGDPEDSQWVAPVMTAIGTGIGSIFGLGPVGAFFGGLIGQLAGGEPDDPYAWTTQRIDPNAQGWVSGGGGAMNHARAGSTDAMANNVQSYLLNRAQAEGLMVNPERANYGYTLGFYGPNHDLFFDTHGGGRNALPGADTHEWSGTGADNLASNLYDALVGQGYFTAQPGASWGQVSDYINQTAAANPVRPMDYGGDMAGATLQGYDPGSVYWGMQPVGARWDDGTLKDFVNGVAGYQAFTPGGEGSDIARWIAGPPPASPAAAPLAYDNGFAGMGG